jgi:hypothetical protein
LDTPAQWIWHADDGPPDTWMCFRRQIELPAAPTDAVARVAVDSKYWLWVNGRIVVREGGLKRGPNPRDTYCDVVDLAEHLHAGANSIAVLVWYWGRRPNYSHNDSGKGGLLVDGTVELPAGQRVALRTDASWKARVHPSFGHVEDPDEPLAWQLPCWAVCFDANAEPVGWQQPGFDDAAWPQAVEKGAPPCAPWGRLVDRPVPFWRDYGLREFENAVDLPDALQLGADGAAELVGRLPYNAQFTTCIELKASAAVRLEFRTDTADESHMRPVYVCRPGRQRWELPAWINGHALHVRATGPPDAEIKLGALRFRESGIDADFAGRFECDDPQINRLWTLSARTTYLCVRDNYMDCPDRERAQWWGDAVNEILQTFYCLDPRAHASIRKGIREIFAWQRPSGVLVCPAPHGAAERSKELPTQMQAGVWILWPYYLHTADAALLQDVFPAIERYLAMWEGRKDARGLYEPAGEWLWFDWGEKPRDGKRICNLLHCLVLAACAKIADVVGKPDRAREWREWHDAHRTRCRELLWDGGAYGPDDRANAVAALAGLAAEDRRGGVLDVLTGILHASPYMERYCEEALCVLGRADLAVERMKRQYAANLASGSTTLYELFPTGGTKNHAWAGGPLYIASAYLAGVRPLEAGWARFQVTPQPAGLRHFQVTVPTVAGNVEVELDRDAAAAELRLSVPSETTAQVGLPFGAPQTCTVAANGTRIWHAGRPDATVEGISNLRVESARLWLAAAAGRWTFRVEPPS